MSQRSPFLPKPTNIPVRKRLLAGWGTFFVLVLVGVGYALVNGRRVPVLLDLLNR